MKRLLLFVVCSLPLIALGQVAVVPVASPVAGTVVNGSPLIPAGLISGVVLIVVCLNIALSAVQKIFTQLGKGEPSVLSQISGYVAKAAQWLGSNPSL